jgi:hypothetical protein
MGFGGNAAGATGQLISAEGQAKAAEYNAAMAKYEARYAKQKAKIDEETYRKTLSRNLGSAQAIAGATGFGQGGTNEDLIAQIRREGEIDAAMIRMGGDLAEWQGKSEAKLLKSQAQYIRIAGAMNAASTMMGGSGQSYNIQQRQSIFSSNGSTQSGQSDLSWTRNYRWSPRQ